MLPLRKIALTVALGATIVASLVDLPASDTVPPAKAAAGTAAAASARVPPAATDMPSAAVSGQSLREHFDPQATDLFASHSWQPPPPPPPKPEPPKAPPLPFRYLGKVLDEGQILAFVGQGVRTHLLRTGDVLAEYKIDEITPTEITFVYLPLNEKQHMTFGSSN
ncbi:MAG: hypothetical protein Q7T29_14695 [Gallionella sp.]|nr:hypothetical protein [Gallionella sp.]